MIKNKQSISSLKYLNQKHQQKNLFNQFYSHACLPARQVTDHAKCELFDEFGGIKVIILIYTFSYYL